MNNAQRAIIQLRNKVLKILSGKAKGFFLGGGTALSIYYLNHRESFDLDFFTDDFSEKMIRNVISEIEISLNIKTAQTFPVLLENRAKMKRCYVPIDAKKPLDIDNGESSLKIDFIEDVYKDIESKNTIIEGIPVLSQENIYLKKIYAACGVSAGQDVTGRNRFVGGRQEAKDFFDLYFLSKDFIQLSEFVIDYCPDKKENVITWYHSYDRKEMKLGLTDIMAYKKAEFQDIERHFKLQIDTIIKKEL